MTSSFDAFFQANFSPSERIRLARTPPSDSLRGYVAMFGSACVLSLSTGLSHVFLVRRA